MILSLAIATQTGPIVVSSRILKLELRSLFLYVSDIEQCRKLDRRMELVSEKGMQRQSIPTASDSLTL